MNFLRLLVCLNFIKFDFLYKSFHLKLLYNCFNIFSFKLRLLYNCFLVILISWFVLGIHFLVFINLLLTKSFFHLQFRSFFLQDLFIHFSPLNLFNCFLNFTFNLQKLINISSLFNNKFVFIRLLILIYIKITRVLQILFKNTMLFFYSLLLL